MSNVLSETGCSVHEADGARSARRILANGIDPDLFIVDYAMPDTNGVDLIKEARRNRPGLKVLLVTGYAGAPQEAEAEGITVLRKPFSPADLIRQVSHLLDAHVA
jgi:DNA-binding NtrC family response regulator